MDELDILNKNPSPSTPRDKDFKDVTGPSTSRGKDPLDSWMRIVWIPRTRKSKRKRMRT
jgi:hypothetical protein